MESLLSVDFFFFSSRRRHTRCSRDWSSDVCSSDLPDPRCGKGDTGPGASIHGANSHPDVFTVAAVTVTDRRLGYSSQGPGALYSRKPDLAGFSHFKGSGIYPVDGGTSAASPVAAGVAAAPRPGFPTARRGPRPC